MLVSNQNQLQKTSSFQEHHKAVVHGFLCRQSNHSPEWGKSLRNCASFDTDSSDPLVSCDVCQTKRSCREQTFMTKQIWYFSYGLAAKKLS